MAYIPLDSETKVKGKAISLQGSNRAYLEDFEKTFWAAPTSTAAIRGVRPSMARLGSSAVPLRTSRKKPTPVAARTTGVMRAATPHPYFLKMKREASIMVKVTVPVAAEKSPMKAE